jgi:hypothetical protein
MLDGAVVKAKLDAWILGLPCQVELPPGFDSDKVERSLPKFDDMRRYARLICRGKNYRAALGYRQTLSVLPRSKQWYGVYTMDMSRGGCGFLHCEPLYPGERMIIVLLGGTRRVIEIIRCQRLNDRCYSIGAQFVQEDPLTAG